MTINVSLQNHVGQLLHSSPYALHLQDEGLAAVTAPVLAALPSLHQPVVASALSDRKFLGNLQAVAKADSALANNILVKSSTVEQLQTRTDTRVASDATGTSLFAKLACLIERIVSFVTLKGFTTLTQRMSRQLDSLKAEMNTPELLEANKVLAQHFLKFKEDDSFVNEQLGRLHMKANCGNVDQFIEVLKNARALSQQAKVDEKAAEKAKYAEEGLKKKAAITTRTLEAIEALKLNTTMDPAEREYQIAQMYFSMVTGFDLSVTGNKENLELARDHAQVAVRNTHPHAKQLLTMVNAALKA